MRPFRGVALALIALLCLGSCSQILPILYLVNNSGGMVRILHASNDGQRNRTLVWWGDPWSYFALLANRHGHDVLSRSGASDGHWSLQLGANGCRAWYAVPFPPPMGFTYLVVRLEPDQKLYFANTSGWTLDTGPDAIPDQPDGYPITPTERDCSLHLLD